MKFGINQAISQTITLLSCIQLDTPSSRLWNFWWIKTYTTFKPPHPRGPRVLPLSAPSVRPSLRLTHDDVIKWKHFPRYWPFVRGIHLSPANCPHKGQWRGALMFSLICVWINDSVNNCGAGDLRRYRAHYDVIVMCLSTTLPFYRPHDVISPNYIWYLHCHWYEQDKCS